MSIVSDLEKVTKSLDRMKVRKASLEGEMKGLKRDIDFLCKELNFDVIESAKDAKIVIRKAKEALEAKTEKFNKIIRELEDKYGFSFSRG